MWAGAAGGFASLAVRHRFTRVVFPKPLGAVTRVIGVLIWWSRRGRAIRLVGSAGGVRRVSSVKGRVVSVAFSLLVCADHDRAQRSGEIERGERGQSRFRCGFFPLREFLLGGVQLVERQIGGAAQVDLVEPAFAPAVAVPVAAAADGFLPGGEAVVVA